MQGSRQRLSFQVLWKWISGPSLPWCNNRSHPNVDVQGAADSKKLEHGFRYIDIDMDINADMDMDRRLQKKLEYGFKVIHHGVPSFYVFWGQRWS